MDDDNSSKTIWPRLSQVHFEDLPVETKDFRILAEWLTERGRRPGTFTVTLARGAMWRLKKKKKTLEKEIKEIKEMLEVVCLEKGRRVSLRGMWPPKDT